MKKLWNIVQYFVAFVSIIGIILCIYRRDLDLLFKGIICLVFWISMILENKATNKNKIVTKIYWVTTVVLISLFILDIISI